MRNNRRSNSSDRGRHDAAALSPKTRVQIAALAAKLIAETGLRDFEDAKRRAAESFGIGADAALPSNLEIDAALRSHQRLFQSLSQPAELAERRRAALTAMDFFADFEPRLVGAVLDGTADRFSAVCLHLFIDDPRQLEWFLQDRGVDYEAFDRPFRDGQKQTIHVPAYRFARDSLEFDLSVFETQDLRAPPMDRVTLKPMRRADRKSVLALLSENPKI